MKRLTHFIAVISLLLLASARVAAQSQPNRGTNMTFGLSVDQTRKLRAVTEDLEEMRKLARQLELARKEAIEAGLAKDASVEAVRAKIEAVAKIQTEIAMLRYQSGVKLIAPSVTETQKAQALEFPGVSYNQLFVGKTSGLEFVRGGDFTPN